MRLVRTMVAGLFAAALLGAASPAFAFFPGGIFSDGGEGTSLRLPRWTLDSMDVNGDGDVSGPNEGVPITFEGGEGGWTVEYQTALQAGFEVWENVPSSFIAFRYTQTVQPELELELDLGASDFVNFVAEVSEDPSVLPAGTVGLALVSFIPESTNLTINGVTVPVTGPALIDVDAAINKDGISTNTDDTPAGIHFAGYPATASAVQLSGLMIGLSHSPLQNIEETLTFQIQDVGEQQGGEIQIPVEPRVWASRQPSGALEMIGVTPSMYPIPTYYDQGNDVFRLTWLDLAPDDIAGVTYLYPRGDMGNFFEIAHEARFDSQVGFPSAPIVGGYIQVWCDADNNSSTPRVPMYSTYTGLYENQEEFLGFFRMINLFKQIESPAGVPFTASYTLTLSEVEPPEGSSAEDFDSTHNWLFAEGGGTGAKAVAAKEALDFSSGYPEQTFLEGGENIYDMDRHDEGTPLEFDPVRSQVVSTTTGRTIEQMLPGTRPMFGASIADTVCPLNLAAETLKTTRGTQALREFRDGVLLQTALGAAVADAYYRAAPVAAEYLLEHRLALDAARAASGALEWSLVHWRGLAVCGAALAGLTVLLGRRRRLRTMLSLLLVAGFCLVGASADAQTVQMSIKEMVALSDDIVTGKVVARECRWTDRGQIITDISIEVDEAVKGRLNRDGLVHLSQLGGEKDGIVTYCPQYPRWRANQEVVVLLKKNPVFGYMPVGGVHGKYDVRTDPRTGEKRVAAGGALGQIALRQAKKQTEQARAGDDRKDAEPEDETDQEPKQEGVTLDDFTEYLRDIVKEQQQNAR